MKENGKRILSMGCILLVAFILWTVLIQVVDVQSIGPNGTEVGFAAINMWFHSVTGVHMALYVITDWLGLVPIIVCMVFAGIGFVQLIKRRSLFKVDYDILVLGIYYVMVILCYLIFEMLPINYRPILIEGSLEASYPSSTTLLVFCVMPTLVEQVIRRVENRLVKKITYVSSAGFSAFMVLGRLVSGVHWVTDILGAILISGGLFLIYKAVVLIGSNQSRKREI